MVKNWPESCLDGHKKCPKPTGDFIPTPLIEIVHIQYHKHPRLCLRKTYRRDFAPYAALGYCWGGNQPVITASKNIYQHIIRFNYIALPAIIQDAMTITSRLGLRYIQIDSLCIIQNDSRDQNYEIGEMPSIYSQATVTISASRAASVWEGFLQDRKPFDSTSLVLY